MKKSSLFLLSILWFLAPCSLSLYARSFQMSRTVLLDKMCRRVEGLRYEGLYGGYPKFAWERCEWQTRFEVQYAPMGSSSWRSVATTSMTDITLLQDLDPVSHYWLRVRALCDHHCHIHDTLLMGEWSDTLEFCLTPEGVEEADQSVSQVAV